MRIKGQSYRKAYTKFRETRLKEIVELKREVRELKQLVEYLCSKVFDDESS